MKSQTIKTPCACGSIYLIIDERGGKFFRLGLKGSMTKECPCGAAWLDSMAGILTFGLRRAFAIEDREERHGDLFIGIIKQLKNQRCNNESVVAKSCVHQISDVLSKYIKTVESHIDEALQHQIAHCNSDTQSAPVPLQDKSL